MICILELIAIIRKGIYPIIKLTHQRMRNFIYPMNTCTDDRPFRQICNIDIMEIFPSFKMKLYKHRLRFSHNIIKPISKIRCLIIQQNIAKLTQLIIQIIFCNNDRLVSNTLQITSFMIQSRFYTTYYPYLYPAQRSPIYLYHHKLRSILHIPDITPQTITHSYISYAYIYFSNSVHEKQQHCQYYLLT